MEDWQREHITRNLHELASNTIFNGEIQAQLRAKNVLGKADVEKLNAQINQNGNFYASNQCYDWLMGRTNAYKILTQALAQSRQTGAARILIDGVPTELFGKPLTYLGISTEIKRFEDEELEVNGKMFKVHQFFPGVNYQTLQQIFQETVTQLEIYDTFIMKQRTFVLAKNTVPPKPPIYLPRFLSNRIKVDESIFKADCRDVFFFKNSLPRHKLSQIARPHFTDTSTSQITNITCRFIYLEENEDWTDLKKSAKAPIHLIKYEADQDYFLLEDSSAPSDILKILGSRNERVYMREEEFVQQQLSEESTPSSLCICDTPGMGKTFLLANIARQMAEKCAGRVIVFIQLTSFAEDCSPKSPNTSLQPDTSLINVLSYTGSSQQNPQLLFELVKVKQLSLEIFFDGFDELPADKLEWTRRVFRSITTFQNVRIYITSRPHMRCGLETSRGVVAYDILSFNRHNQVDFLVQFWINRKPDSDQVSLQSYAADCLEAVNQSLDKKDKEIAGIPLLCQLIAEVCADKKAFRLIKTRSFSDVPLQISAMYRKFIENQINLVTSNKDEFDNIKLVHIWHALKLLFPTHSYHKTKLFQKVKHLLISSKMVKAGIFQIQSNGALEFMHRTFAEYLVAEYFSTKLQKEKLQRTDVISILKLLKDLEISQDRYDVNPVYCFQHSVVVSFFNSTLDNVNISEGHKIAIVGTISFYSENELICILYACCSNNLFNVFSFLGEAMTKCDISGIAQFFTHRNCYELLRVCIKHSTSQMFHSCIKLLTDVPKLDSAKINTFNKYHSLLQLAAEYANYAAVEYFVDKVSLQKQSLLEKCVLSFFDIEKRESILLLLLNKDPTLIHKTPDILYKSSSNMRFIKILVKFGANLTDVNGHGGNYAMKAATYMSPSQYHELVQILLTDRKARYLFVENEKWSDPLLHIINRVTLLPETVELLFKIPGIDMTMKDRWEESLLFSAVKADDMNELEQLVQRGVDYNARVEGNKSLLHVAAHEGKMEMVRYLLSLKLDPSSRDEHQWTPLHCAALKHKPSVMEVLVEYGANVQAKTVAGQTALHFSATWSSSQSTEIILYLIRKGAEVNDRDEDGNTPLHLCTEMENIDCLIEMGADIHAKNKKGRTVLHVFTEQHEGDSVELIKDLIRKGAQVNDRDNKGNTPLHLCFRRKEVMDCLIEMGADIYAKNNKGKTPAQKNHSKHSI